MKKQNGITLIALIITIIVMLILVGVSVTVALKGGLFTAAKNAANNTKLERDNEIAISNGDIIDQYLSGTESITWTKTSDGDLAIGNIVEASTGEKFYVIGGDTVGEITDGAQKVILLAEHCIVVDEKSEEYLKQSPIAKTTVFSSDNYWSIETDETKYPLDLNTFQIPEGETSVIGTAKSYGLKFGKDVKGRLMTVEEVETLGGEISSGSGSGKTEKCESFINSTNYWLSSAFYTGPGGPGFAFFVNGENETLGNDNCLESSDTSGVRPIIEISKSAISNV